MAILPSLVMQDYQKMSTQSRLISGIVFSVIIAVIAICSHLSNPTEDDFLREARAKVKSSVKIINSTESNERLAGELFLSEESWLFKDAIAAKKAKNQDSIGLLGELFESVGTVLFQENIIASINNQANRKCKNYWFLSYCDFFYDDKLFMSCNGKFGEVVCDYIP